MTQKETFIHQAAGRAGAGYKKVELVQSLELIRDRSVPVVISIGNRRERKVGDGSWSYSWRFA